MDDRMRARTASRYRPTDCCDQCGEPMFLPEWSEYLSERRVRHLWSCEACGYRFETTVTFAEAEAA